MPIGTCDPATRGEAFNAFELVINGVAIWGRYGWDGVSTRETGCDGPIIRVWARNDSAETRWAWFEGRRGQPKSLEMAPGFNGTWGPTVLANRGFESYADLAGLIITDSAEVPPNWRT